MFLDDFDPFASTPLRSVSIEQAGYLLGVSRRTIYYWIRSGRLETVRTRLGSQRVLTDSLKSRWLLRF